MQMNTILSNSLSPASRVWIYAADKIFSDTEAREIDTWVKNFAAQWTAHKMQLASDGGLLYNCFLVLMADESYTGASGCSIDASVRFVKETGAKFQANFFNRLLLYELANGEKLKIHTLPVATEKYASGELSADSKVFNHLVTTKADFSNRWLITLSESPLLKLLSAPQNAFNLTL